MITASGGPFRGRSADELAAVTIDEALAHPTWAMGPKITIDSSTLMNKGLEVIEAHELFGIAYDQIEVVVHPQSVVHSMVEFTDGSTIAQLSMPDMRLPIGYALGYPQPDRHAVRAHRLGAAAAGSTSSRPTRRRSAASPSPTRPAAIGGTRPGLAERRQRGRRRGVLAGRIRWNQIPTCALQSSTRMMANCPDTVDDVIAADQAARRAASNSTTDRGQTPPP